MQIPKLFAPPNPVYPSRRAFLRHVGNGFGLVALGGLLEQEGLLRTAAAATGQAVNPLAPKPPHFPTKAKSVIWLFMNGGAGPRGDMGHQAGAARGGRGG